MFFKTLLKCLIVTCEDIRLFIILHLKLAFSHMLSSWSQKPLAVDYITYGSQVPRPTDPEIVILLSHDSISHLENTTDEKISCEINVRKHHDETFMWNKCQRDDKIPCVRKHRHWEQNSKRWQSRDLIQLWACRDDSWMQW